MELAVIIQSKIYEIRGQRVMLDFDLADTYSIETKVLKQAVKRNIKRFEGEDFMFTLTKEELSRSQIVTLNKGRGSNFGNLNKAVKRNIKRFPSNFMFQLTAEEFETLKSNLIFQNGISSWGGDRKRPYVFTEQTLAMLSGILNSQPIIE